MTAKKVKMGLMFPKGNYNKNRTIRRGKRLSGKSGTPERVLQQEVDNLLASLPVRSVRVPDAIYNLIFNPTNRVPKHLQYLISGAIKGQPDNIVLMKDGRYFCLELKTEKGKQSREQKLFESDVFGNYYLCRSIDDVMDVLRKYELIK